MAFTQSALQAEYSNPATRIIAFTPVSTTHTVVSVQNSNATRHKFGTLLIAQTNTAAQAKTAMEARIREAAKARREKGDDPAAV